MKIFPKIDSIVTWGTNEARFIAYLRTQKAISEAVANVLKLEPPVLVLCEGFEYTKLIAKVAKKLKSKTTIVKCRIHSHILYLRLAGWVNSVLASYSYVHATVVQVNGVGVMIQGESGIGKSEVALQLIKRGALFVGDDAIEIANIGDQLNARPSKLTSGFMEVRGVGMIDISRAVGINNVNCKEVVINMIINLNKAKDDDVNNLQLERLRENQKFTNILGVKIPIYNIPITTGRDVSYMIEAAVSDFKLREQGYNCAREFDKNLKKVSRQED